MNSTEFQTLEDELEANERDAKRYRWMRRTTTSVTNDAGERMSLSGPDEMDAVIDRCIEQEAL